MALVVGGHRVLFAVMGTSTHALVVESLVGGAFLVAAVVGFRSSVWVVDVVLGGLMAFSILSTVRSSPTQVSHAGGRHSVSRTTPRQQGAWRNIASRTPHAVTG